MRGKRAKAIASRASELIKALGIKLNDGYNKYDQIDNCVSWELAKSLDGKLLRDPEGHYLRRPVNRPGTIRTSWKYRQLYQWLKKMYKRKDPEAMKVLTSTTAELDRLTKLMGEL